MKTFACIGGGIGGGAIGAKSAGYKSIWNIDKDPDNLELSSVGARYYTLNCHSSTNHITVQEAVDDLKTHRLQLERPDVLLISWSCKNFSGANHRAKETVADIDGARAIVWMLNYFRPHAVVFENVPAWKRSRSWVSIIKPAMSALGYLIDEQIVMATDFGVPQTRKRLIVRASLTPIFAPMFKRRHKGWYSAIASIINTFPVCQPSKRQVAIVEHLKDTAGIFAIKRIGYRCDPRVIEGSNPIWTIRAALGNDYKGSSRHNFLNIFLGKQQKLLSVTSYGLARLQGFDRVILPDEPKFAVSLIGNAIPPPVAESVFRSLLIGKND